MPQSIIIATKNEGKIREITEIVDSDFEFLTYKDFNDWPEIEETGKTFLENALQKARMLSEKYDLPAIADDSGLEVEALEGQPGVASARYAGVEQNDSKNVEKLVNNLRGEKNRKARFKTVAVYYHPDGRYVVVEGEVEGEIIEDPRGTSGFGYDPVFMPKGYDKTMAELSLQEKNTISHRGKAFRKLREHLIKVT